MLNPIMIKKRKNVMTKCLKTFASIFYILFFVNLNINNLNAVSEPDFSEMAEELVPSVVSVSVMISREAGNQPRAPQFPPGSPFEEFFKDFFERRGVPPVNPQPRQRRSESAMGSGFIIDKKGLIVTNNHVVANAKTITVILHDGTSLQANLIGADQKTDLALLKVKTDIALKEVDWGNSDNVKVGNWAMAIATSRKKTETGKKKGEKRRSIRNEKKK